MGKKFIIGIFGLVVIALCAVLVVPHFINWNEYKTEIASQLKSATGRDVTIAGELSVRIIPTPALTVGEITIANLPGATNSEMVKLDTLQVRVALLPLLGGEVQVERVLLKNPIIHLEKLSNGQANWNFSSSPSEKPSSDNANVSAFSDEGASGTNIKLDSFEISNATVVYLDNSTPLEKGKKPKEQRIDGLDLSLRAESLSGPFEGKGRARVLGVQISFDFSSGAIIEGRTVPLNLSLLTSGETRINASGAVIGLGDAPHYKGKVEINTSNLADIMNAVAGNASAPKQLGQPFSLGAIIDASADIINLDEMEITIGDNSSNRLLGSLSVGLKDGIQFALDLKGGKINLDEILSNTNGAKDSQEPAIMASAPSIGGAAGSPDKAPKFEIPTNISGKATLKVSQITIKNQNISEVELKSNIGGGVVGIERISAQLPGVSALKLDGSARAGNDGLVFNGKTSMVSSKPMELASWMGVSLNDGIAQRVRQVSYQSNIQINSQSLTLSGISVALDRSHLSGGITLALRDRLSFGASIEIDSLNLDSYFPQTTVKKSANDNKSASADKDSTSGTVANIASVWSALRALNDFDANTKIKAGEITQGGNTYKNISFDGTLYAGQLEIRDARVGSFAGSAASLKGKFNGFGGIPEMSGVGISLATNNVATLARQYGVASVPEKIGAAKINISADGSLLKPKINVSTKAMGGEYGLNGAISFLPLSFGFNGHATLKHAKPIEVFSNIGLAYRPKGPLAGMDLGFDIKTDGKEHQISNISGTLDATAMAGGVNISTAGTKTGISAALQTGAIYLEHFMPAEGSAKTASNNNDAYRSKQKLMPGVILASWNNPQNPVEMAQATSPSSRASKRWSRDNIDLSVLDTINADVTLVSSAVYYGKHKLDNADIHATVANGVLLADRIKATAYGGPVSGSATIRAKGQPTMEANLNISALDVGGALMAASKQAGVKGALDFNLGFNASGKSAAELVSSLNGNGGLDISGLDVKQSGKGNALSGVIGLVAAMNQLSIPAPGSKGGLAELKVGFDIKNGIATLGNATISSAMGQGSANGSVDIAAWGMDVSGLMTVEPNLVTSLLSKGKIGRQEVPFSLKGALDGPGVNFGIRQAAQPNTPTTGDETVAPAPSGQPISPEQLILEQIFGKQKQAQPQPQQPAPQPDQQTGQQPAPEPAPQPQRQLKPEELLIQGIMGKLLKK